MKQGSLFCFVMSRFSQTMALGARLLVALMSRGASTGFETVWSYDVEAIKY